MLTSNFEGFLRGETRKCDRAAHEFDPAEGVGHFEDDAVFVRFEDLGIRVPATRVVKYEYGGHGKGFGEKSEGSLN